jgi:lipopolysaccharide heptosyltransferase III
MQTNHHKTSTAKQAKLRLLFVKLKRIGDALLLTATLVAVRENYPDAEIWVVVRRGTEGILAGCPAIDRIVTVAPVESEQRKFGELWRQLQTLMLLRAQNFDYAFELSDGDRSRLIVGLSAAFARCVNTSRYPLKWWLRTLFNRQTNTPWTRQHRVVKDYQLVSDFLPLAAEIPPLSFIRPRSREPEFLSYIDDFVVLHPGTYWVNKRWPKEYWVQLGHGLLERVRHVIVSSGPNMGERALAGALVAAWGSNRALSTDGKLDWAHLAGCLYRARAFIGVDTAATHLAAACQCPIVAIFGHSAVHQWHPWKAEFRLINMARGPERTRLSAQEIMKLQTPEMVLQALDEIIRPSVPLPLCVPKTSSVSIP